MRSRKPNPRNGKIIGIAIVLIVIGVLVNLFLTLNLALRPQITMISECQPRPLPCGSLPIRFVLDDPVCADKLLRAMNVTNVRILERNTSTS